MSVLNLCENPMLICTGTKPILSSSGIGMFLKYFLFVVRTVMHRFSASAVTLYTSGGYDKLRILHSKYSFVTLLLITGYKTIAIIFPQDCVAINEITNTTHSTCLQYLSCPCCQLRFDLLSQM